MSSALTPPRANPASRTESAVLRARAVRKSFEIGERTLTVLHGVDLGGAEHRIEIVVAVEGPVAARHEVERLAGRQERRIGLDQQQIRRDDHGSFAQRTGIPEADRPGQAHHPAVVRAGSRHVGIGRKTVEDHFFGRTLGSEYVQYLGISVAVVDHQRLAGALGQVDVPRERLFLRRLVSAAVQLARPVHVHARLTDRDDARVLGQRFQSASGLVIEGIGAGRVQRDRGVDARVLVCGSDRPLGSFQVVRDGDYLLHADRFGTVHDLFDACRVGGATRVQMGVGIDQSRQRFGSRRLLSFGAHLDTLKLTPNE